MVSDPDYADNAIDGFKKRLREDGPLASFAAAPAMTMMVGETATSAISSITTVVADDSLLLASGGLIGFLFVFLVVGTIIVNFGIMKK